MLSEKVNNIICVIVTVVFLLLGIFPLHFGVFGCIVVTVCGWIIGKCSIASIECSILLRDSDYFKDWGKK